MRLSHILMPLYFFSSRRRHTRFDCDWSSDVCSSDLGKIKAVWYNQPFLVGSIKPGKLISVSGKVKLDKYGTYLQNPSYEMISEKNRNFASRGAAAPRMGEIGEESEGGSDPLRGLR